MAQKYKLWYFNARGQSEVIRLIFAAAGIKYEDFRFEHVDWPKYKPLTPFGKVPMLEIKNTETNEVKNLSQSNAICRYLANEFKLNGQTNFENAQIDMYIDQLKDVFFALVKVYAETDVEKQKTLFTAYYNETVKSLLESLEKKLQTNNTGYLVGESLTWLDLAIIGAWDWIWLHDPSESKLLNEFKLVKEHNERIRSIPNVATWLETRPKTER